MKGELNFVTFGVFNGRHMVAKNGTIHPVPQNYASKSKLVEGDTLKMYTNEVEQIIYKQVNLVQRRFMKGILSYINNTYQILTDNKAYLVLESSIHYFDLSPGDGVSIAVPAEGDSTYAVIVNPIPKKEDIDQEY